MLTLTLSTGLLRPTAVLANTWPRNAFQAANDRDVIKSLFADKVATPSKKIEIKAPMQADGAAVPVNVIVNMDKVETIAITIENDQFPLRSVVNLTGSVSGYNTRIRMSKTSSVTAFVMADGKLYSVSTRVKITKGGYGMNQ
jgi:predicted secreted protein